MRSAEVLELASLVINARERLMLCEGSLSSVIHFFPPLSVSVNFPDTAGASGL